MNRRVASSEYKMLALIALGVVALLAVVIWVPKLSFIQPGGLTNAKDRARAESDLRGHLLQALAGLVLVVGAFYTARTYALNREGQITERFTRAVEQLGDQKNLDIRLGGIYALERIAHDSETHYEPVMEVLTAFLREHTRRRRSAWTESGSETGSPADGAHETEAPVLRGDFQAAAAVLGRRDRRHERPGYRLDLSGVDLAGLTSLPPEADLHWADLSHADLSHADLSGADLYYADLSEANLSNAKLRDANLRDAKLSGAKLYSANLSGADLSSARDLTQQQLRWASTMSTKLPHYLQEAESGPGGEPNA